MIIGTPIIGVMALMGITPIDVGVTLNNVHSRAITAPASIVIGSNVLWLDVLSVNLAI